MHRVTESFALKKVQLGFDGQFRSAHTSRYVCEVFVFILSATRAALFTSVYL
jgi:hypothetical protein